MSEKILAILEPEKEYANLFLSFLEEKQELPYKIRVFTKEQALQEFLKEATVDVLLAAERSNYKELEGMVSRIIILVENKKKAEDCDKRHIYKFQSAERILQEVCKTCIQNKEGQVCDYVAHKGRGARQYGVFSPYGGIGKTTVSLVLGHLLGRGKKVLIVNLEAFSKRYHWLPSNCEAGMSQLFYYVLQGYSELEIKLASMVVSVGNASYLCGVTHYLDLQAIEMEQMDKILTALEQYSDYDVIIYDMSFVSKGMWSVCKRCDVILEPVLQENYENTPEWATCMSEKEWKHIEEKRRTIVMPEIQERYTSVEYISQGVLGAAVSELIQREGLG